MSIKTMFNGVRDKLERVIETASAFVNGYSIVEPSAPVAGTFLHQLQSGDPAAQQGLMTMFEHDRQDSFLGRLQAGDPAAHQSMMNAFEDDAREATMSSHGRADVRPKHSGR